MPHFEDHLTVEDQHIDALGHVNNVIYLQWVQDMAAAHWRAAAPAQALQEAIWVVRRHVIDYHASAVLGDQLRLRTEVSAMSGAISKRWTRIYRGDTLLLTAESDWVLIDRESGKPKRILRKWSQPFLE